jgi:hypothetical protein
MISFKAFSPARRAIDKMTIRADGRLFDKMTRPDADPYQMAYLLFVLSLAATRTNLRHHPRQNPLPGIDLQFRLPNHPGAAIIGDLDNFIQLQVGSKSEGLLVLAPKLHIRFLPSVNLRGH